MTDMQIYGYVVPTVMFAGGCICALWVAKH
jgi:hypothetical protein